MQIHFEATLTKIATKRAKRDKDGIVTEEPALSVTVDVPVSGLSEGAIGALLRAMDRALGVDLDDGQTAFEVVDNRLELATNRAR